MTCILVRDKRVRARFCLSWKCGGWGKANLEKFEEARTPRQHYEDALSFSLKSIRLQPIRQNIVHILR